MTGCFKCPRITLTNVDHHVIHIPTGNTDQLQRNKEYRLINPKLFIMIDKYARHDTVASVEVRPKKRSYSTFFFLSLHSDYIFQQPPGITVVYSGVFWANTGQFERLY